MFRDEVFIFFPDVRRHVPTINCREGCCRPEQLSSEGRGHVRMLAHWGRPHHWIFLMVDVGLGKISVFAGEVKLWSASRKGYALSQPRLTGYRSPCNVSTTRCNAPPNPRFWVTPTCCAIRSFLPVGHGLNISLGTWLGVLPPSGLWRARPPYSNHKSFSNCKTQ